MAIKPILREVIVEVSPTPALAKQVEKTISRYAKPTGCCNTLVYVMNRIKNMVLSIFGCSDWQRTVRAMRKELNAIIEKKFQGITQHVNLPKRLQNEILAKLNTKFAPVASKSLEELLKLQNNKKADDQFITNAYKKFTEGCKAIEEKLTPSAEDLQDSAVLVQNKTLDQFLKAV